MYMAVMGLVAKMVAIPSAAATNDSNVALANGAMSICFAGAHDGFGVDSIVNLMASEPGRFVNRDIPAGRPLPGDLWQLEITRKGKEGKLEHRAISNRTPARRRSVEYFTNGIRFVFEGVDTPTEKGMVDVVAEVRLPEYSVESLWDIRVENHSREWGVYYTLYPTLRGVMKCGEGDFYEPSNSMGWDRRVRYDWKGQPWKSSYSSGVGATALAFTIGDAGLLYASHNSRAETTKMMWLGAQSVSCCTPVEEAGTPDRISAPGFPVSIGMFKGDWVAAAKLYRTWATNQVWCAKGRKFERTDIRKDFVETPLWLRTWGGTLSVSNAITAASAAWPGMRLGVHLYEWQNAPHDINYPEYFPAKAGMADVMSYGRTLGYIMMPYVNFRLYDMGLVSFTAFASACACVKEDGTLYVEKYSNGRSQAVMCPSAEQWQNALCGVTDRVIGELGSGAIYLDQLGESKGLVCFGASHQHPRGGGAWWREDYVNILRRMREAHPSTPFTTEGCGEIWMDVVDGYLRAVPPRPDAVPFYAAVYSDFTTYFGSPLTVDTDIGTFRAIQARQFTWGIQPGWMTAALYFGTRRKAYADWMFTLGKARQTAAKYLAYGEFLDILRPLEPLPKVACRWRMSANPAKQGVYDAALEPVIGAWWRSPEDGSVAIVAVNHTEERHVLSFRTPCGEVRRKAFEPLAVVVDVMAD